MKKIIILPGEADSVFFMNEIDFIEKYFNEIIVISYRKNEFKIRSIAKEKDFKCHIVKINVLKALFDINFYRWLFDKNTKEEIRSVLSLSKKGLAKILYILYYGLFYINAKKYIDKEIKKSNNDDIYLYSFWLTRGAYTIANYNVRRGNNCKKIFSRAHGYDLYEERNKITYLPFRNFINQNLDEIYFISKHGLDYFNNKYKNDGLSSRKHISRLGTFNYNNLTKKVNKKDEVCIVSCSSIIPVKRIDLIIDIISEIKIPVKWIHIGIGSQKEEIESYARNKLKDGTYCFLGYVDNSEILKTYEKYDVDFFINMSDSEGIPVSIMEAMSMGIPVIARDVGGVSEIVNVNNGLLLKNINNKKQLYNIVNKEILQRINNVDYYREKVKECKKTWIEKYNAESNYDIFFSSLIK